MAISTRGGEGIAASEAKSLPKYRHPVAAVCLAEEGIMVVEVVAEVEAAAVVGWRSMLRKRILIYPLAATPAEAV